MANPLYIENYVEAVQQGRALRSRYPMYGGTSSTVKSTPVLVPVVVTVQSAPLGASSTTQPLWTAPNDGNTYKLLGVAARFSTASSSGTLQIETAAAATAPGSGVNQLTGTVSLAGTANTTVNGTVVASPTTFGNGSSLNIVLGGTLTSLANLVVIVTLQRVS